MPNRSKIKGSHVYIYINGKPVACDKTCTFEQMSKTEDTTTKCNVDANGNLWSDNDIISNGWKITGNGLSTFDGVSGAPVYSAGNLIAASAAQLIVYATWTNTQTGELYGGDCIIANVKRTDGVEAVETFDYELLGKGAYTTIPVS